MQPVIQEFITWFGKFIFCASAILIAGHVVGRQMRARKAARLASQTASQPTGGMKKSNS